MTLKQLQSEMKPWTVEPHFTDNADPTFMFKHALFHTMKAAGKIADSADEHDHRGSTDTPTKSFKDNWKQLADLVICSMKMASEVGLDLQKAVEVRMRDKGLL